MTIPDMPFDLMYKAIQEELEFTRAYEAALKVAWKMILIDSGVIEYKEINGARCLVRVI